MGVPWPWVLCSFSPGLMQGIEPGVWFLRDVLFHQREWMASLPAPCLSGVWFHWGVVFWNFLAFYAGILVPTPPPMGLKNSSSIASWELKQRGLWRLLNTPQSIAASAYVTTAPVFSSCFILHLKFIPFLQAQIYIYFYLFSNCL